MITKVRILYEIARHKESDDPSRYACMMPVNGDDPTVMILPGGKAVVAVTAAPNAVCAWHEFHVAPCGAPIELMIGQKLKCMATIPMPGENGVVVVNFFALLPWPAGADAGMLG